MEDKFVLGGKEFKSRFILGSGKYNLNLIKAAVEQGGAEIITLALRRANTQESENILDFIPEGVTLLPNTSGARNAEEAVRIARLSRAMGCGDFVKVEIMRDAKYLFPDNYETIKATEILAKEGFVVLPYMNPDLKETLTIWDMQLVSYGSKIIERRKLFVEQLNEIIYEIHKKLSGGREEIRIQSEPDVELDEFESKLRNSQDRDMRAKMTSVGPHRDDFSFLVGDVDIRKFGSQGQQRTAALSLKLSEIELVKRITKDTPVLLLDDVLSELDSNRQNYLLNSIGDIQTIITCTGLEEFVNNRFEINRVFKVSAGTVTCVNENMGLKSEPEETPADEYNFGSL